MTLTSPVPRPSAIVSFERLFLLTIGIGVVQAVVGLDELVERAPASTIVTTLGLTLGTQATLVLLVSRGRNSAAKWVLLAMLGIGLPLYFSSLLGFRSTTSCLQTGCHVAWPRAFPIRSVTALDTTRSRVPGGGHVPPLPVPASLASLSLP